MKTEDKAMWVELGGPGCRIPVVNGPGLCDLPPAMVVNAAWAPFPVLLEPTADGLRLSWPDRAAGPVTVPWPTAAGQWDWVCDPTLRVDYGARAVREHFDGLAGEALLGGLTDADLERVGEAAMNDDRTWKTFHQVLADALRADLGERNAAADTAAGSEWCQAKDYRCRLVFGSWQVREEDARRHPWLGVADKQFDSQGDFHLAVGRRLREVRAEADAAPDRRFS